MIGVCNIFILLAALLLACNVAPPSPRMILKQTVQSRCLKPTTIELPAETRNELVQSNGSFRTSPSETKLHYVLHQSRPPNITTTTAIWVIPIKFVYDECHGTKPSTNHKLPTAGRYSKTP